MGDEYLRADGHTDMTMLTDTFSTLTTGLKMNGTVHPICSTPLFIDMDSTDFTFHT